MAVPGIADNPGHPWTAHEGMGKSFGYNAEDMYKYGNFDIVLDHLSRIHSPRVPPATRHPPPATYHVLCPV